MLTIKTGTGRKTGGDCGIGSRCQKKRSHALINAHAASQPAAPMNSHTKGHKRHRSHKRTRIADAGPRGTDKRLFVEAVLWIVRTGSPWRDLPEEFGKCNTVFKRFRDWVKADIWQKLFDAVSGQPDMQYAMVDATIVKVHRHGQGAGLKARP